MIRSMKREDRYSSLFRWTVAVWVWTLIGGGVLAWGGIVLMRIDGTLGWVVWSKYAVLLILLVSLVGVAGYMPLRLRADGERMAVGRLFGALKIPLSEVEEARMIPKSYLDGTIRTFGSGGMCGYFGRFRNKRLGSFTMYATNLSHLVWVRTRQGRRYVFGCGRRMEEFLAFVQTRLEK